MHHASARGSTDSRLWTAESAEAPRGARGRRSTSEDPSMAPLTRCATRSGRGDSGRRRHLQALEDPRALE